MQDLTRSQFWYCTRFPRTHFWYCTRFPRTHFGIVQGFPVRNFVIMFGSSCIHFWVYAMFTLPTFVIVQCYPVLTFTCEYVGPGTVGQTCHWTISGQLIPVHTRRVVFIDMFCGQKYTPVVFEFQVVVRPNACYWKQRTDNRKDYVHQRQYSYNSCRGKLQIREKFDT